MRFFVKAALLAAGVTVAISFVGEPTITAQEEVAGQQIISPYWDDSIRQWEHEIGIAAEKYRLDPDLIAAVIQVESHGRAEGVSYAGAVGLMAIMPHGPEFSYRPTAAELVDPAVNLSWGSAILADILQQSGGDIHAALAAYNGGWFYANYRIPREYSAAVLDFYGRAVAARNGVDPGLAVRWTIAIEMGQGSISAESWLLGGKEMPTNLRRVGEHLVFNGVDKHGRAWHLRGAAIPIEPVPATIAELMY